MKKVNRALKTIYFPSVFLSFVIFSAIIFRSFRSSWIFISKTVGFEGFCVLLLILMIIDAVVLGTLLALRLNAKDIENLCSKKAYKISLITASVFSVVFLIFAVAYSIGNIFSENREVFLLTLKKTLEEGVILFAVPFLILYYPKLSYKKRKVLASVLLFIIIIFGVNSFYPITPYKITSEPLVINNGSGYSVVFSTNDYGTACVEYSYNGKDYKVFDNTGGRLNSDKKIHSIIVPYEHLNNNSYKVSSTRVIEEFSYGSRRGKTVTSPEYEFKANYDDNQTWLVISDWHTKLEKAYAAIDNLKCDFDGVILLGDASPGVDFEEQVVTNTVQFGGKVSGGVIPVIYARGNHETRGAYAKDLSVALGLKQFYYTTDIGPYSFVVLDSGEDKDDSHIEYGGMNDYNNYRADMIEWLKETEVKSKKVIAISHCWELSSVEPELSQAGFEELDRLNTRLLLSGHHHTCRLIGEGSDKEKALKEKHPDIIAYLDGGSVKETFVASMIKLDKDSFEIYAVDNNGIEHANERFNW